MDKRLEHMDRCINQLVTDNTRSRHLIDQLSSSSPNTSFRPILLPLGNDIQLSSNAPSLNNNNIPVRLASQSQLSTTSPVTEASFPAGK
jgi:hypothetical protein